MFQAPLFFLVDLEKARQPAKPKKASHFTTGDVIHHKQFGRGTVSRVGQNMMVAKFGNRSRNIMSVHSHISSGNLRRVKAAKATPAPKAPIPKVPKPKPAPKVTQGAKVPSVKAKKVAAPRTGIPKTPRASATKVPLSRTPRGSSVVKPAKAQVPKPRSVKPVRPAVTQQATARSAGMKKPVVTPQVTKAPKVTKPPAPGLDHQGKSTGTKGRPGLIAKKVQVTRGGSTFMMTVYVDPKTGLPVDNKRARAMGYDVKQPAKMQPKPGSKAATKQQQQKTQQFAGFKPSDIRARDIAEGDEIHHVEHGRGTVTKVGTNSVEADFGGKKMMVNSITNQARAGKIYHVPTSHEAEPAPTTPHGKHSSTGEPVGKEMPHEHSSLSPEAQTVNEKLKEFGVKANVVSVIKGPTVSTLEISLGKGTSYKKLDKVKEDIAIALKLDKDAIRIDDLPGKDTVGLEIPNKKHHRENVSFRDVVHSEDFRKMASPVKIALGKDKYGNPLVSDISSMPHLLIGGTTGSGKSVLMHSIISSLIQGSTPDDVQMTLIDPKAGKEFGRYEDVPHVESVAKTTEDSLKKIDDIERELRQRMELTGSSQSLDEYNRNVAPHLRLPRRVVVIDEFADMMRQAGKNKKNLEKKIVSIAQLGRAVGIHLVAATQRPSKDVITGAIKDQFDTRIGLKTADRDASDIVLDQGGAEGLYGKGDMLFRPPGSKDSVRAQSAFLDATDIANIIKNAKEKFGKNKYEDTVKNRGIHDEVKNAGFDDLEHAKNVANRYKLHSMHADSHFSRYKDPAQEKQAIESKIHQDANSGSLTIPLMETQMVGKKNANGFTDLTQQKLSAYWKTAHDLGYDVDDFQLSEDKKSIVASVKQSGASYHKLLAPVVSHLTNGKAFDKYAGDIYSAGQKTKKAKKEESHQEPIDFNKQHEFKEHQNVDLKTKKGEKLSGRIMKIGKNIWIKTKGFLRKLKFTKPPKLKLPDVEPAQDMKGRSHKSGTEKWSSSKHEKQHDLTDTERSERRKRWGSGPTNYGKSLYASQALLDTVNTELVTKEAIGGGILYYYDDGSSLFRSANGIRIALSKDGRSFAEGEISGYEHLTSKPLPYNMVATVGSKFPLDESLIEDLVGPKVLVRSAMAATPLLVKSIKG